MEENKMIYKNEDGNYHIRILMSQEPVSYTHLQCDHVHVYFMSSCIPKTEADGFRAVRGEEPGESASDPNLF